MSEDAVQFSTVRAQTMADDTLRLTVDIEPRAAQDAFRMFGQRGIHGAMVRLKLDAAASVQDDQEEDDPSKGPYGVFWSQLIRGGFFRVPKVLRAIGTEREFEQWIQKQRSVLSGKADWIESAGARRCECAHVRRVAEGSGTAEKPPFFAVPLTREEHRVQHDQGEEAALEQFGPPNVRYTAKDWFELQADRMRTEWASNRLAERLDPDVGHKSRSLVGNDLVIHWIEKHNFEKFLPKTIR